MVPRQILHYLVEHPDAKDTIEGVCRWWLPKNCVGRPAEEVQEALDMLVARGWVTQRQTPSARQLYGVNKEKLEEIRGFLHASENQADEQ